MRAAFRFDAGPGVGGGHLMRCLVLARALARRGAEICILTRSQAASAVSRLLEDGFAVVETPSPEMFLGPVLESAFSGEPVDILVVDHYGVPAMVESAARAQARHIVCFDDMPTRFHDCDLLVDQNFGAQANEYNPLIPSGAVVCAGAEFALVRDQFVEARRGILGARKTATRHGTLVCFGMSDSAGLSLKLVKALRGIGHSSRIEVIAGSASAGLEELGAMAVGDLRLVVHVDAAEVAPIMARTAIAVGAGGSMHWERCCLALPTIAVVLEENQRRVTDRLAGAGAVEMVSTSGAIDAEELAHRIVALEHDTERRKAMSAQAAAICDGQGSVRLCKAIEALVASRANV